jgi:hypothetical protein
MQVRPREAAEDLAVRARREAELRGDFGAHVGRRGGGAREHALRLQPIEQGADAQIVRPEVVPPLGDAVRFVDRDERRRPALERRDERVRGEALGRDVDERVLSPRERRLARAPLVEVERRGEVGRRDPARLERADLVLHQRDERREDERRPAEDRRGELVSERLSAARRRDDEGPPRLAEHRLDRLLLPRPEGLEPEAGAEDLVVRRGRG